MCDRFNSNKVAPAQAVFSNGAVVGSSALLRVCRSRLIEFLFSNTGDVDEKMLLSNRATMIELKTFTWNRLNSVFGGLGNGSTTQLTNGRTETIIFNPPIENATAFVFSTSHQIVGRNFNFSNVTMSILDASGVGIAGARYRAKPSTQYPRIALEGQINFREAATVAKITFSTTTADANLNISKTHTFSIQVEFFPLLITPRSINVLATLDLDLVGNGVARVTYEGLDGAEVDVQTNASQSVYNIVSLIPATLYVFRLYIDGVLIDTITTSTLENLSTNYEMSDFFDGNKFNLQRLSREARLQLSRQMNTVLSTGDILQVKKNNNEISTRFVKRGENITAAGNNLLVPFVETGGSGQHFNLELEEVGTTVTVGYNETSNTVVIASTDYGIGDTLILDGKKCTIEDYEES